MTKEKVMSMTLKDVEDSVLGNYYVAKNNSRKSFLNLQYSMLCGLIHYLENEDEDEIKVAQFITKYENSSKEIQKVIIAMLEADREVANERTTA